ncbi:MAG: hypothetical protein JW750_08440 [Anaerolineaceae bacterium]|nr:hypothetical protein [Anaerolineaceae bacterium]
MMNENGRFTPNDWQLVSDYLDEQLSSAEKANFEIRLKQDGELREIVARVRWTKSVLRRAPKWRARHNFTLTRQMAMEVDRSRKLNFSFSIVSGLATLLFVSLLGFQVFSFMGYGQTAADTAIFYEEAMVKEAAPQLEMDAAAPVEEPAGEEPMMMMAEPSIEMEESAAAEAMPAEEEAFAEDQVEPEPTPTMARTLSPDEGLGGGPTELSPENVSGGGGEPPETATPTPEAEKTIPATPTANPTKVLSPTETLAEPIVIESEEIEKLQEEAPQAANGEEMSREFVPTETIEAEVPQFFQNWQQALTQAAMLLSGVTALVFYVLARKNR